MTSHLTHHLETFFSSHVSHIPPKARLLVAVSGGEDSVALLTALSKLNRRGGLVVGHVNHHLRGSESDRDAQFVRSLARSLKRPYVERTLDLGNLKNGNLEETARVLRYESLIEMAHAHRCPVVVTAHHLNDQAETILLHLFRGTGVKGLAGMEPVRHVAAQKIVLARPFLKVSKEDIHDFSRENQLDFRPDATNTDNSFNRNWIRNQMLPLLTGRFGPVEARLGRLASILYEEEAYWGQILKQVAKTCVKTSRQGRILDFEKVLSYPAAVQRRFLRSLAGPDLLTFDGLEQLFQWMKRSPTSGRQWLLKKGWFVERLSKSKGSPSAKHFVIGRSEQRPLKKPTNKFKKRIKSKQEVVLR